ATLQRGRHCGGPGRPDREDVSDLSGVLQRHAPRLSPGDSTNLHLYDAAPGIDEYPRVSEDHQEHHHRDQTELRQPHLYVVRPRPEQRQTRPETRQAETSTGDSFYLR